MAATSVRAKPKKSSYIRVGHGFANESGFRVKLRGNTGDIKSLPDECRCLDPVHPETGRERRFLPSEAWVDVHFTEIADRDPDGEPIVVRYYQRNAKGSPLNGAASGMVRCKCGKLTPPNAFEGDACIDCRPNRIHEQHGASPSAHAIQQLQHRNLRMEDKVKLKPEDMSSLRREIKRVKQGKWIPRG